MAKALRSYLSCGVLWHGFARFRCDDCAQSRLVALSCKQRAFCPRCVGRRMADQAKHLVERVLPPVRTRQWVLTFPHELRWHMAFDHDLTLAVWGIARRAIDAFYKARARSVGPPGQHDDAQTGSIMAIQRFGGALNLNVHFHAVYLDGAFVTQSNGSLRFLEALPPTADELETLLATIKARVTRLARRRGLADLDADAAGTLLLPGMGELYSDGVVNRGAWRVRTHDPRDPSAFARRKAHDQGFDLDAHIAVRAGARAELERMVRYILRPPLKEKRLTLHADSVVLELKTPWRDGTTHIRMSRERFIDRLVALVPPPAANTLLYGGILGANARLRRQAIRYERPGVTVTKRPTKSPSSTAPQRARNTAWAELMRHSFGLDVLACPHCGGRMRHVATILSATSIRAILRHQGHAPPEPRAGPSPPAPGDTVYEADEATQADLFEDDLSQAPRDDTW